MRAAFNERGHSEVWGIPRHWVWRHKISDSLGAWFLNDDQKDRQDGLSFSLA